MNQQTISARYIRTILRSQNKRDLDFDSILDDCGINANELDQANTHIETSSFARFVTEIIKQTEDEFLGFAGSSAKARPGSFKMMSHAIINCANLEQAMHRCTRFYELFDLQATADIFQDEQGMHFRVLLDEKAHQRSFAIEAAIFLSLRYFSWLVGRNIIPKYICLDYSEKNTSNDFRQWVTCPIFFNQKNNQFTLEISDAHLPLIQTAFSLEEFLKHSLEDLLNQRQLETNLELQIRSIVCKEFGNNMPDFVSVCERLNLTTQTVRRRLRKENSSYQQIKDNIRKDNAIAYLGKTNLTIDEIALAMGFSEVSSFHRAFKKWTNQTPSFYRKNYTG